MLEPFKVSFFLPLGFHLLIFDRVCSLNKYFPNIFQLSKRKKERKATERLRCSERLWLKLVLQVQPSVLPILAQPFFCKMHSAFLLGNSQHPWHHTHSSISHQDDFLETLKARKMLGRCGSGCFQLRGAGGEKKALKCR